MSSGNGSTGAPLGPRLTPKSRAFVEAYLGLAEGRATEAARIAGYGSPSTVGKSHERRLAKFIEEARKRKEAQREMGPAEVTEVVSRIARSSQSSDDSKIKAAGLLARIHGMLKGSTSIRLDRREITVSVRDMAKELAKAGGDETLFARALTEAVTKTER